MKEGFVSKGQEECCSGTAGMVVSYCTRKKWRIGLFRVVSSRVRHSRLLSWSASAGSGTVGVGLLPAAKRKS
jgi:hypothetical protein